jgi:hypothetical protein
LAACVAAQGTPAAQDGEDAGGSIYQQRTADGRIVLTDRPLAGATTQRTWQAAPVDAAAARQRREEARLEALAVTERIERQLEAEREQRVALARAQPDAAETRLASERARADDYALSPTVVFVPAFVHRPFPRHSHGPRTLAPKSRLRVHPGPRMHAGTPPDE